MNMISQWFTKTFSDTQMVLLILVVFGAILTLTFFGSMLAPALAAIVIAFLLDGPIEWLKRKGARPALCSDNRLCRFYPPERDHASRGGSPFGGAGDGFCE